MTTEDTLRVPLPSRLIHLFSIRGERKTDDLAPRSAETQDDSARLRAPQNERLTFSPVTVSFCPPDGNRVFLLPLRRTAPRVSTGSPSLRRYLQSFLVSLSAEVARSRSTVAPHRREFRLLCNGAATDVFREFLVEVGTSARDSWNETLVHRNVICWTSSGPRRVKSTLKVDALVC